MIDDRDFTPAVIQRGPTEAERRMVWTNAWCACAASTNCTTTASCDNYADSCLESFDKKFGV